MKSITLPLLFFMMIPVYAYEPERAKVIFAHEAATCYVFYMMLVSDDVRNRNIKAEDSEFMPRADLSLTTAVTFSNQQVTAARVQMEMNTLMKEIDEDMSNFSILVNRLSEPCGQLISKPEERFIYWQDKK